MAWKVTTHFFVAFVCRFILFLYITALSWLLLGVPNVNTCFLTVFMSCIIPLPPTSSLTHPIHFLLSKLSLALRAYKAYTVVFTEVNRVIFISIPHYVLQIVLYGCLDSILGFFINHIRFTIPNVASKVLTTLYVQLLPWLRLLNFIIRMTILGLGFDVFLGFTIPKVAYKVVTTMYVLLLPWLRLLNHMIRMSFLGLSSLSTLMMRMVAYLLVWTSSLIYKLVPLRMSLFLRKASGWFVIVGAALVCVPGLEPLPNLLITGNLYPGSLIRFQRCAKYEDGTSCHATFLEFSYTVWNLTRTGIFVIMCWTTDSHAWKPPRRDLASIVERCLALNNNTYSQLLLCAAGLPLLMNGHCLSQTVHNMLSTASLLLFLVTLNGYYSRTAFMTYHAFCCVATNIQSVLVAMYNIYRNLQTQKTDYIVTFLYIMELYLMLLVIMDTTTRVINKVKNPEQDIMSQDQ